jgi:tyrosine-protein phosphatase YwqE
MWLFNKKYPVDFNGFKDCHSHILPGVDDGVQKIEDSLLILKEYERMGISEVVFTPHIMEDVPNTPSDLRKRFAAFKEAYHGPISLHLAAEYMIDHHFEELLASGDLLTHGEGNHILVETSYFNRPSDMDRILFDLQSEGYEPILAHPERYMYMDLEEYGKLKDKGILFQMNLASLSGMYGTHVKQRAEYLMKNGHYDMAGSDIHRISMIQAYKAIRLKNGQSLPMPEHI